MRENSKKDEDKKAQAKKPRSLQTIPTLEILLIAAGKALIKSKAMFHTYQITKTCYPARHAFVPVQINKNM